MRNPALHEIPRSQPAAVIPLQRDASILDWLEKTGRLIARETVELPEYAEAEEEINALMGADDGGFDDADDDDDDSLDLDD